MITVETQDMFPESRTVIFKSEFSNSKDLQKVLNRSNPDFNARFWRNIAFIAKEIMGAMVAQRAHNYNYYSGGRAIPAPITESIEKAKKTISSLNTCTSSRAIYTHIETAYSYLLELTPSTTSRFYQGYKNKLKAIENFLSIKNQELIKNIEFDTYRMPDLFNS